MWNRDDWLKMKDETWLKYGHRLVWEVRQSGPDLLPSCGAGPSAQSR